jgi:murein DD-endopeptidase MepM/ murein hydrolase activator NlpD
MIHQTPGSAAFHGRRLAVLLMLIPCGVGFRAQTTPARIEARVVGAPTPFTGSDGQVHLAYELLIGAPRTTAIRLDRLDGFSDRDANPLVSYASSELDERVMHPNADRKNRHGRMIENGTSALVHVWITLANNRLVPAMLRHSIKTVTDSGAEALGGDAQVDIRSSTPLIVGSPFRGQSWLAHNGPGGHLSPHWGSALIDEHGARIPQRYAIDFIGLDTNGRAVKGNVEKSANEDWVGFGREVLAVADGVVHSARDGLADNAPLAEPPPPLSASVADSYGNYVIVALDDHTFVHYAHLRRNSVTVKTGQTVRRGQVIGHLGNSGNTNGAHLHFNVTDKAAPEEAQGVPYVFDTFDSLGTTTADAALGAVRPTEGSRVLPVKRTKALPLDDAVVRFQLR